MVNFVVESVSGVVARSTALLADSLDNLGDATTYALSLYAVERGLRAKAKVALFKAALILAAALFVLGQVAYRFLHPGMPPIFEMMGAVSLFALAANVICLTLLWKHREEDVNMSSVWECSRNDIASNLAVFLASGLVWLTESRWPDLAVGLALAALLLIEGVCECVEGAGSSSSRRGVAPGRKRPLRACENRNLQRQRGLASTMVEQERPGLVRPPVATPRHGWRPLEISDSNPRGDAKIALSRGFPLRLFLIRSQRLRLCRQDRER